MAANEPPKPAASTATPAAPPTATPAAGTPTDAAAAQQAEATGPSKASIAADKAKKALGSLKSLGKFKNLGALSDTKELVTDLASSDRQTRRMARYFIFSVAGVIGVLIASGLYIENIREEHKVPNAITDTGEQGKNFGDFIKKQADEAKLRHSTQSLGVFSIELKGPPKDADGNTPKRAKSVMDLAEVEIIVECDEKETCEFIEDRMPLVRNEVTGLFTAMEREDLLSREGKRKLRNKIQAKLNLWLPNGKVQNIYFTKLIIS